MIGILFWGKKTNKTKISGESRTILHFANLLNIYILFFVRCCLSLYILFPLTGMPSLILRILQSSSYVTVFKGYPTPLYMH